MKFKDSTKYHLNRKTLQFDEGNFYITDTFVVGEINEGAHFSWETAEKIIEAVYECYDSRDINISYISNRINNYSISPVDWYKFFTNNHKLRSISIISYSPTSLAFYFLEKFFIKTRLEKFDNLEACIEILSKNKQYNFRNLHQERDVNSTQV